MSGSARISYKPLDQRIKKGLTNWKWPFALVFTRLVLGFAAQALTAAILFHAETMPMHLAAQWWTVYGTLIDIGCFLLIKWQIKKEGLNLKELIHFDRQLFRRDVLAGLTYILWVFPLAMVGLIGFGLLIYGNPQPISIYNPLPFWATVYSLLIFPAVWGFMEQITYNGYALPRLKAGLHSATAAIVITTFGWGIQHIALPFFPDGRYMLYRFLSFLPLAAVMTAVYLRKRRLIPFIIAHWMVDTLGVLSGMILPTILVK